MVVSAVMENQNSWVIWVIEIPYTRLNADTLSAVVEEFILREGTDYGAKEVSLNAKKAQVRKQLEKGEVLITFDPRTENCTLLTRQQFKSNISGETANSEDHPSVNEVYENYSQDAYQESFQDAAQDLNQDSNHELDGSS